jgi:selenide,water dikinase
MTQLNKIGEVLGNMEEIHALTDVTGFGLLGHLLEMVGDSDYSIELYYDQIPVIEAARHYLKQRIVPDATYRNWNHYHAQVEFGKGVDVMEAFNLLPDPQTNGGLLIAVPEKEQSKIQDLFIQTGLKEWAIPIGKVISQKEKRIIVLSLIE